MNFAVNVSTIFKEVPFLQRFERARQSGFSYVECQFPYDFSEKSIKEELLKNELSIVLMNMPPGNYENGERGIAIDPSRVDDFKRTVDVAIAYATELQVPKFHCLAGKMDVPYDVAKETFIKNIEYCAEQFAMHKITVCLEPINNRDMPNYFLNNMEEALSVLKSINKRNVQLQFDFYHIENIHGNAIKMFEEVQSYIGHVQWADAPGRHEPGTGEINFKAIAQKLKELRYDGFIGLEYKPKGSSEQSFQWMKTIIEKS